jgi:very-short-patch-repair endonuclease
VEPERVRRAVWAARREHGIGWEELCETVVAHARPGRSGVGPLRAVVADHYGEPATDSATEDLAYTILRRSQLVPTPQKQVGVTGADGVEVTVDLGWPERRALVELDGVDHLTNGDLQHLDRHRRNQIELAGYKLLVYTGQMLRRQPDQFVRDVVALLGLT